MPKTQGSRPDVAVSTAERDPDGADYPNKWTDREVWYQGEHQEQHGVYRVARWDKCFDIPCVRHCARFVYVLAPVHPAAVRLSPDQGIRVHGTELRHATADEVRTARAGAAAGQH